MKKWVLAVAFLFAAEAALACVCIPLTPELRRETAGRIASEAAAVAEIERIDQRSDTYGVLKLHVGQVPAQFGLAEQEVITSCDTTPLPDGPTTVVLYKDPNSKGYRIGGTCDHLFINTPGSIELVKAATSQMLQRG